MLKRSENSIKILSMPQEKKRLTPLFSEKPRKAIYFLTKKNVKLKAHKINLPPD